MFAKPGRGTWTVLTVTLLSSLRAQEPLTLDRAVAIALERNPLLRSAADEAEAVRARVEGMRSPRRPHLEVSETFTRGDHPVYVFGALLSQGRFSQANLALPELNDPAAHDNVETRLGGSWTLLDFGHSRHGMAGAQQSSAAQDQKTEQARQDLILRVVQAYYGVQVAAEGLTAAHLAREAADSSETRVRALDQAGQVVASDLLRIQVHGADMAEREIRASNALELARMRLETVLGLDVDSLSELGTTIPELRPPGEAIEEYEKRALAGRPALRAAQLELEAAREATAAARRDAGPRVQAHGAIERDSESLGGASGTHWLAGVTFQANLYTGGERRARISESIAREHRAENELAWLRSNVLEEVRSAYLDLRAAEQRVIVTRASIEQAEESRRILQNRYDAGLATMTELLAAQVSALDARVARLAALYDGRVARVQLERAAGRLTHELELDGAEEP